jgi:uncharacterized protein involved in exopolysaccharide biosynthesis
MAGKPVKKPLSDKQRQLVAQATHHVFQAYYRLAKAKHPQATALERLMTDLHRQLQQERQYHNPPATGGESEK